MKKTLCFIILIFASFLLASCDDKWAEENGIVEADMEMAFENNVEAILNDSNSSTIQLDLKSFYDKEENPIYDKYKELKFYPKKDVKQFYFGSMIFTFYMAGEAAYQTVILKISIEDLVIEYETIEVEITLEDGSKTTELQSVEKSRHYETIYLNGDGEKVESNGTKGLDLGIDLDYEIVEYSSSTAFKFEVFQEDGITPVESEWALDFIDIICIDTEEKNK